jgi:hypothetical protein
MMVKRNLRELILALALFFNPLGYNEVFVGIMALTGTYWSAAFVMYCIAAALFLTYLGLRWRDRKLRA